VKTGDSVISIDPDDTRTGSRFYRVAVGAE
jgi:hypothetical protein